MKVLFIITGLGMGGAEQQVVSLADHLAERNHQVTLCYLTGDVKVQPTNSQVQLISLNINKKPWALLIGLIKLRRVIQEIRPDIIHSHMVHANLMARLARPFLGFKNILICSAHNKNEGGKLRMLAYRLTDGLADISTNVSQEAVNVFVSKKAVKKDRMIAMYNGIDIKKFMFDMNLREKLRADQDIPQSTKVIIAVGRLTEAKDYPNLLQAYAKLENIDTVLWIVGEGDPSYKSFLIELTKKLAIDNRVFFLGIRNDIPALLSAADIFVLSSAWEGFGLVVAEAMACQRLVVATDSGGVKEVLGDCGWLVPCQQSEQLYLALVKALSLTSVDASELTKKARQRIVMNYNIEQIVEQWLQLYQNLLEHKHVN